MNTDKADHKPTKPRHTAADIIAIIDNNTFAVRGGPGTAASFRVHHKDGATIDDKVVLISSPNGDYKIPKEEFSAADWKAIQDKVNAKFAGCEKTYEDMLAAEKATPSPWWLLLPAVSLAFFLLACLMVRGAMNETDPKEQQELRHAGCGFTFAFLFFGIVPCLCTYPRESYLYFARQGVESMSNFFSSAYDQAADASGAAFEFLAEHPDLRGIVLTALGMMLVFFVRRFYGANMPIRQGCHELLARIRDVGLWVREMGFLTTEKAGRTEKGTFTGWGGYTIGSDNVVGFKGEPVSLNKAERREVLAAIRVLRKHIEDREQSAQFKAMAEYSPAPVAKS